MADITDPSLVEFVVRTMRPLAEKLVAMRFIIQDAQEQWTSGANAIGNDPGDMIADTYNGQETNELNAQEVANLVTSLSSLMAILDTAGAIALVDQFRIRDISVIV